MTVTPYARIRPSSGAVKKFLALRIQHDKRLIWTVAAVLLLATRQERHMDAQQVFSGTHLGIRN